MNTFLRALFRYSRSLLILPLMLAGCTGVRTSPPSTGLLVIESDHAPAFAQVTREIARRWTGPVEIHRMNGGAELDPAARRRIAGSSHQLIAAVGLPAALAAQTLRDKTTVFCQVFGYREHNLVAPRAKGVALLPPADRQLRLWKQLAPGLARVGVITGRGLPDLLGEMQAAARAHGVALVHREVTSDLETLYAFRRMASQIDGLWLVPDNRVLSPDALSELLSVARTHGKQVLVFNDELLSMGALISVESEPGDIAAQVVHRLREMSRTSRPTRPDITPLNAMRVRVNTEVAMKLGLKVPKELKEGRHVR